MSAKSSQRSRNNRRYSQAFKQARVDDFEKGTFSVSQICRLYNVPTSCVYSWISKYSRYPRQTAVIVEVPNSQTEKVKQLESRIAELERMLGQKQIKLDYYEAFLEELKVQGVDVEKKDCTTAPWPDS